MAVQVLTNDSAALTDSDLDELASMEGAFGIGELSKAKEDWVLATTARIDGKLHGFTFSTLERIGGTPCVLIGCASIKRTSRRDAALRAMMTDQFRRAVLAFPDEDVLVGTRLVSADGFEAFKNLDDIVPRPDHKASGEERAWGRRLAKRFGIENGNYRDRDFIAGGDGSFPLALDHESLNPDKLSPEVIAFFGDVKPDRGDSLIAFGWAMAEDLAKLS